MSLAVRHYDILISHQQFDKNSYDLSTFTTIMAGQLRKGERIPRRPLPEFEEAGSLAAAISRDGLIKSSLEDTNEFGPHSMIIMLVIVATLTGGILLLFKYI
ncbi:MAG: hypothetical protein CMB16_05115 [Euryarchaeota archaeon]|nr:hypothetical protein [Euryarchaeota archaeon]|tara:strand:- start:500 stop:805 length:306 start_codon:yes stop_codon:yes gene_type:complete